MDLLKAGLCAVVFYVVMTLLMFSAWKVLGG